MLLDVIKERRSIRKYTDQKVSEDQIREILEAAFWAPTAVNRSGDSQSSRTARLLRNWQRSTLMPA